LTRILAFPKITWIIGRVEARLMSLLPEIEFLTLDKRNFAPISGVCARSSASAASICCSTFT
jgi:hypothetical protein